MKIWVYSRLTYGLIFLVGLLGVIVSGLLNIWGVLEIAHQTVITFHKLYCTFLVSGIPILVQYVVKNVTND
jgi:hypothetical protein